MSSNTYIGSASTTNLRSKLWTRGGFSGLCAAIEPELKAPDRQAIRHRRGCERRSGVALVGGNGIGCGTRVPMSSSATRRRAGRLSMPSPASGSGFGPTTEPLAKSRISSPRMIPRGDPVWPLSRLYIEGIPAVHRRFSEEKDGAGESPCLACGERRSKAHGNCDQGGRSRGQWRARLAIHGMA